MNKKYIIESFTKKEDVNWDNIPKAFIDENGWNSVPQYSSFAQLAFIENLGFIVRLKTNESNPWANYKNDGDLVSLDSCLEVFLRFNDEGYINLETNAISTKLHGFGKDRYGRISILSFGMIPHVEKCSDYWLVEYFIPIKTLEKIYQNLDINEIKSGFSFTGNFYKTGKNPESGLEHYYMWNRINTPGPDFHQPSQFGTLIIK